ncbi:MAG TPA: endonuclease, partial [Rhodothermales bacterium]|nr:endonuclease [Rhodothermales bacterium]
MRDAYSSFGPARRTLLVALFALASASAAAQTCPASGTTLYPGLDGQQLRDSLAANYYPAQTLSYENARDVMYATLDNVAGIVTCRYSGYTANIPYGSPDARALATAQDINAEHTWPQSMGAENAPMHDDLHHLYPVYESVNSARNNHPFAEIPDDQTNAWYRLTENTATPNPAFINEYSERDGTHPNPLFDDRFEPREDHKGNVARSMFYFYTVYQAVADAANPNFFPAQRDDLRGWVVADPVTPQEYARTCTIQGIQGNVNPFVIDPTLVERAFFSGELLATLQFTTSAGSTPENGAPINVAVSILGAHPDAATTVEVALTGGTATNGADIATFDPTTITFAAGNVTPQTFTVTPQNDDDVEGSETLVFTLQNVSANGRLGSPVTFTLTLTDD